MTNTKVTARVFYKDPRAALAWLEKAFGFKTTLLIADAEGNLVHSEVDCSGERIMVAGEYREAGWEWRRSPASAGGVNTQMLHIRLDSGLDEHCERARAADASIFLGPRDEPYGERFYMALDPEGHMWSFEMRVRDVSNEGMEQSMGLRVEVDRSR